MSYIGGWDGHFSSYTLNRQRPIVVAGPCTLESYELGMKVAEFLVKECAKNNLNLVFKSCYDKANRSSKTGKRGPGIDQGLKWMQQISNAWQIPLLTDIHAPEQAAPVAEICTILQIPAFLSRHRPLLTAAAATNRVIEIKKHQGSAPEEMIAAGQFILDNGNNKVVLCDRGACFGYHNLVADMRTLIEFRAAGFACMFDATHSAMLPGAAGGSSGGLRHVVPALARAACAVGIEFLFMEVHPTPHEAWSDKETQLDFALAAQVLRQSARIANVLTDEI